MPSPSRSGLAAAPVANRWPDWHGEHPNTSEPYVISGPIDNTVEEVKHPNPMRAMVGEKIKIYPGTVSKEQYWELMPEAAGQALKAFAVTIKSGSS